MRSFSTNSFFRQFELVVGAGNPGLKLNRWTFDDVQFQRQRHSFTSSDVCFAIEVFSIARPGRRGWRLLVAKEYWWSGSHEVAIKTAQWGRAVQGNRREVFAWFREAAQQQPVSSGRRTA